MDLLKYQEMVSGAITDLKQIQRDFNGIKEISKKFIDIMSEKLEQSQIADEVEIENELPSIRSRKRKTLDGEKAYDNQIMNSEIKDMIEVYNVIMDNTITSIEKKFLGNKKMYTDFACLSLSNFEDLQKNKLPATDKIKPFEQTITTDGLRSELLSFSRNWSNLKKSIPETYEAYKEVESDDGDLLSNEISTEKSHCKSCMNCAICCYSVLHKYNLYCNAYSNLALAYKYLLTLPCSQVACERSFSFLKCIKTRLRSTLSENKSEAFMLMGIEKDILYEIDKHEIIELLKSNSPLLKNQLSY
ncbi:unnamed protein product [Macrosiphum euphorbiae]|uniref:HAT C-terminal dimerisation domain-containing protein n=1 Tax=Macrosiphum euphorbiae TaxID=13131 RepID=A0AAV0XR28_9HEMI|nr:unnamed protein product [Macrosiphum euphorbiae]